MVAINWRDELDDQSRAQYEEWLNAEATRHFWFVDSLAGRLFKEPDWSYDVGPDADVGGEPRS